jgi:hypothetical protein
MAGTELIIFRRPAGQSPESFKERLLGLAAAAATDDRATSVVLLVDDGDVDAPPQAKSLQPTFDAALVVSGVPCSEGTTTGSRGTAINGLYSRLSDRAGGVPDPRGVCRPLVRRPCESSHGLVAWHPPL